MSQQGGWYVKRIGVAVAAATTEHTRWRVLTAAVEAERERLEGERSRLLERKPWWKRLWALWRKRRGRQDEDRVDRRLMESDTRVLEGEPGL